MWLGSSFSILPISIASLGIILTVITIIILVRNRDTPLVRASGDRVTFLVHGCFPETFSCRGIEIDSGFSTNKGISSQIRINKSLKLYQFGD